MKTYSSILFFLIIFSIEINIFSKSFSKNFKADTPHYAGIIQDTQLDLCDNNQTQIQIGEICVQCSEWILNCSTCNKNSSGLNCLSCQSEYSLTTNGKCQKCIPNCTDCSDENSCNTCANGFQYLKDSHICQSQCLKGEYYSNENKKCLKCSNFGLGCQECFDYLNFWGGPCITCKTGYTKNEKNGFCELQCQENEFYDHNDNNCKSCSSIQKCITCYQNIFNDNITCESCESGYSSTIVKCIPYCLNLSSHCDDCHVDIDNNPKCFVCSPGYILNSSTGQCDKVCSIGTYYDLQNNQCIKCSDYMANCSQCDSLDSCSACDSPDTLHYNMLTSKCEKSCELNEFVDQNDQCVPCSISNCSDCYLNGEEKVCTNCDDGYSFNSESELCERACKIDEMFIESDVMKEYYCVPCSQKLDGCKECDIAGNECLKCNAEYFLINGQCKKCTLHCQNCSNFDSCDECSVGYKINSRNFCEI